MSKSTFASILTGMCAVVLMGCASIFGKSSYPIRISSRPPGSTVTVTDVKNVEVFKGQTPATVTLNSGAGYFKKASYQVKITAAGYQEQIIPINFKLNGWYLGNLFIGGLLGMLVIDPLTGAMWKLDTPPIDVDLSGTLSTTGITPTLKILEIRSLPEDLKARLVRMR